MLRSERNARFSSHVDVLESRVMLAADLLQEGPLASDLHLAAGIGQPVLLDQNSTATLSDIHAATGVTLAQTQYGLTGAGQTVVIIDSGVAYNHEALGGGLGTGHRVVGGWDFTEENDADPNDDAPAGFHGTHVAGILGSSDGVHRGVAPDVDIVALRIFNDQGRGKLEWLEQALQWVSQHIDAYAHPITTVNLSLGTDWNSLSLPDYAELEDEFSQLRAQGIFVAVAAGNRFDSHHVGLSYPAASRQVISVASSGMTGSLSSYSQRSATSIVAPGEQIVSTVPDYLDSFDGRVDDFYAASGTSMAAPYLAGASILVRQAMLQAATQPITVDAIYDVLFKTADQVWDAATQQSYRALNVGAAVQYVLGRSNVTSSGTTQPANPPSMGTPNQTTSVRAELPWFATPTPAIAYGPIAPTTTPRPAVNSLPAQGSPVVRVQHDTLQIRGTPGDDVVQFDQAGTVRINGQRHLFTPSAISAVQIVGDGGEDSLSVEVRSPRSELQLAPTTLNVQAAKMHLSATGFEQIEVTAHAAGATATFRGGGRADQFTSNEAHSWMKSETYLNDVRGAETIVAWGNGVQDKAILYDGPEDDVLTASSDNAAFLSPTRTVELHEFSTLVVRAIHGGDDAATLAGSKNPEKLRAGSESVSLSGQGFRHYVEGFEEVRVDGGGGNDSAKLHDSDGDDLFVMKGASHRLRSPDFDLTVSRFPQIEAFAGKGTDRVEIQSGSAIGKFVGKPTHSWFRSPNTLNYARGFDDVVFVGNTAVSAKLYDSPSFDTLDLSLRQSVISGAHFQIDVIGVPYVHAISRGGQDRARFALESRDAVFAKSRAMVAEPQACLTDSCALIADGFANAAVQRSANPLSLLQTTQGAGSIEAAIDAALAGVQYAEPE